MNELTKSKWFYSDILFVTFYDFRSYSAKLNHPIHTERGSYRDINTSTSFYNEPYLIGCRTPQSYRVSTTTPIKLDQLFGVLHNSRFE